MWKKMTSKDAIVQSILELAQHKTVDEITVEMIVDNCGFSRRSFYNNFENKYELIFHILDRKVSEIIDFHASTEPWSEILGRICQFMYDNAKLFGYKWGAADRDILRTYLTDYAERFCINTYTGLYGKDTITKDFSFMCKYNASCFSAMVMDFIQGDLKMTPQELGQCLAKSLPQELRQLMDSFKCIEEC